MTDVCVIFSSTEVISSHFATPPIRFGDYVLCLWTIDILGWSLHQDVHITTYIIGHLVHTAELCTLDVSIF